jgi:glutathione S-transferase
MITLFHSPRSRSSRIIFLLEELEAPYEIKIVTTRNREGTGAADPANPHPLGKVPAISDDGVIVFESAAITLYLTDRFPKNDLAPVVGDRERGAYLSLLAYYAGVLEPALISKFMNWEIPRPTAGWVGIDEALPVLVQRLSQSPYLLGARFSAADILYGTTFAMLSQGPLMPSSPVIAEYVKRITARPAFQRMQQLQSG